MKIIAASATGAAVSAQEVLASGGLVVIPTDTVYGLAALLDRPASIARIFELKRRPTSKPLAVLVADLAQACTLGFFNDEARKLAEEGWPGPLTIVLNSARHLGQLGGDGETVGVRVPGHPWCLSLLELMGPLAVTSANRTEHQTPTSVEGIVELFGDAVDLYIDGGEISTAASQVVSVAGEFKRLR